MLQLVEPPKNHQVQLLEHFRAKQKLKDIIKGIVLMPLDHCQAQGINQLSRKPIPMFSQPHSKEYFPNVWPEPHLVQLCDTCTNSITGYQGDRYLQLHCSLS